VAGNCPIGGKPTDAEELAIQEQLFPADERAEELAILAQLFSADERDAIARMDPEELVQFGELGTRRAVARKKAR